MNKNSHSLGVPFYSNCLLTLLLLCWRGRIRRLFRYPGTNHWMGLTQRGHLVHFRAIDRTSLRWWKPFFLGEIVVKRFVPHPKLISLGIYP